VAAISSLHRGKGARGYRRRRARCPPKLSIIMHGTNEEKLYLDGIHSKPRAPTCCSPPGINTRPGTCVSEDSGRLVDHQFSSPECQKVLHGCTPVPSVDMYVAERTHLRRVSEGDG
jgi:hypothetical protein